MVPHSQVEPIGDVLKSLTIEPAPANAVWHPAARSIAVNAGPVGVEAAVLKEFRMQLGLPRDIPVILSGHQPGFWHAGILAKLFAVAAACESAKAFPAWVVVDHDPASPLGVRYPVTASESSSIEFRDPLQAATAPSALPVWHGSALPPVPLGGPCGAAAERVLKAMGAEAGESKNLADQVTRVAAALLAAGGLPDGPMRNAFDATRIGGTELFRALCERWKDCQAAKACVAAYNRAVARFPKAEIRPLLLSETDVELPIWRLKREGRRQRVMWSELRVEGAMGAGDQLVPKALFMTLLLRLAGCDLFVHGLGGGNYDRVMEAWAAAWMPGVELAPSAVVSATLLLEVPGLIDPAGPLRADRAAWVAQAARHHPSRLGDADASRLKKAALHEIGAAQGRQARRDAYRRMQAQLVEFRAAHAAELEALGVDAQRLRAGAKAQPIATDRTWPWMLHPEASIKALNASVIAAFGEGVQAAKTASPG